MSTNGKEVKTLISLETVATVPITTTFNKSVCTFDRLLDQKLVSEEETQADDGKDAINLGAKYTSLLEYCFLSCKCFVLVDHLSESGH